MKDVYYSASKYSQDMLDQLESNIKEGRNGMDLLYACLLDWGLSLSMPHKDEKIDGATVYLVNESDTEGVPTDLIACFDEHITEKVVREIAKRKPLRAVFRDESFSGSPEKINVTEIFKLMAPTTRVKVI